MASVRRDLCQDTDPRALSQQSSGNRDPRAIHLNGLARTSVCRRRRPTPHSHQPAQRLEERNRLHLMCWRELDVMLLVGPDFGPRDVLNLISRVMELPGVVGFDYRDERAERSSTGLVKEERYHVPILLHRGAGLWCLD